MKYILYCRKSTEGEDRQMLSLDAQERELLEIAQKYNLDVVQIFRESMSAKKEGRPIFNEMIDYVKGGKADAILCWKLDRLARNFIDGGQIIDALQTSTIKEIRTYEGLHLPTDNVLMIALQFGTANQYVRDLSTNVKRGNRQKLAQGGFPGNAPFGYINEKVNKTVIPHPVNAKYVKRAFHLRIKEYKSYSEISDILYLEGLRTKSGRKVFKSTVQRVLSNIFHTGVIEREGKLYQGNHEPLISKVHFEEAQRIAEGSSRPRPQTLFFPLRGFLSCEVCGCSLTASLKKGHQYYYCTNGKRKCQEHKSYLREKSINDMVAEILSNLAFSPRKVELAYQAAKLRAESQNTYNTSVLDKLVEELQAIPRKEKMLLDTYLAEQISKEMYDAKILDLKNQKTVLEADKKLQESRQPLITLEPVKNIFLDGITRQKEFIEANDEKKRRIVEKVLWNLSIKDKKIITAQYKSPYQLLANSPKNLTISQLLGYKGSNLD